MKSLDALEFYELLRLRKGNLRVAASAFSSECEELDALRTSLEQELAELRALTAKDWPLSYAVDPLAELHWRRPLAEQKKGEPEAVAQRRAERLARRMEQAHTELTDAEQREQVALRKDWAKHGSQGVEPKSSPIYSFPGDCGRKHLSPSAACACSNIRRGVSVLDPDPWQPPGTGSQAVPAARELVPAPRRHPPPASTTWPASATSAGRPAPPVGPPARSAPAARPAPPVDPSRGGSQAVPAAREPVPPRSGTSERRARILEAVRSSAAPLSANAIAAEVGGRRSTVLDEVRAMVHEGALVLTQVGHIAP